MKKSAPEAQLKQEVLDVLKRLGVWAFGNAIDARGKYRSGLEDGSPDVICLLPPLGCLVAIELKVLTKQSEDQKAWQARFEGIGGHYYLCKSPQAAVDCVQLAREEIRRKVLNIGLTAAR